MKWLVDDAKKNMNKFKGKKRKELVEKGIVDPKKQITADQAANPEKLKEQKDNKQTINPPQENVSKKIKEPEAEKEQNINPPKQNQQEEFPKLEEEKTPENEEYGNELGTIIATPDGPCVSNFSFVISSKVDRGQFVGIETKQGLIIASVSNIFTTNKYFENAGIVREFSERSGLFSAFPVKEWEYTLASCKILGLYTEKHIKRINFPPAPGNKVKEIEPEILTRFLGLDKEKGLDLGVVQQHEVRARINLTKMVQKHLAILAISGAGKSYATAVLLEELLNLSKENGRIAIFMIDNHGEYINLEKEPLLENQVKVYNAEEIKINASHMNAKSFAMLLPKMSSVQVRELGAIIKKVRENFKGAGSYGIKEIISAIDEDENINSSTKQALKGWIGDLNSLSLFSKTDNPNPDNLLEQGKLVIFNFNKLLSLKKKQLIVDYFSKRLFNLRRKNKCPPYLEIIEEAHNFCPEKTKREHAISRKIIETLAREGRKFYANICLISQRPIQLSTTALSQCNTQMIMKITNPYDLDHIKRSSESISSETLNTISGLNVGEALLIGEAVKYPTFLKIRKRKTQELHGDSLEEYAKKFEIEKSKPIANGEDFV